MSYYGYILVTVEDHRTVLTSADNGNVEPTGIKRVVRIEDGEADHFLSGGIEAGDKQNEVLSQIDEAIREVRGYRCKEELSERWKRATENMSPEKMTAALEVLEA